MKKSVATTISEALEMLNHQNTIMLSATDNAIWKVAMAAEIIKRRLFGLHQISQIKSVEVQDHYEPLE